MLELRAINQLYNKQFFIPHYQRGYRWTETQVKQLLEDIDSFIPKEIAGRPSEKTFYCLQPIAIKKLSEEDKHKHNLIGEWYEVIDGQQRLTSIFLILQYINQKWRGEDKLEQFTLNYETRKGSATFLNSLKVNKDDTVTENKEYIDYYYFSKALQTIHQWRLNYESEKCKKLNTALFQSTFEEFSKVIWYEVAEQDGRRLFERLNLGKIPLTNAELVKALFLSSESFKDLSVEEKRIKQFEIAHLWDEIEHKLNENDLKFWSFITNKKRETFETKIELILDMITQKDESINDNYHTFTELVKKQAKDKNGLSKVWDEIEHFYNTLIQWYSNKDYYHRIGYLIASKHFGIYRGVNLNDLVTIAMTESKDDFGLRINKHIRESVNIEPSELRYESHPNQIFNILLLFNVQTYIKSNSISEFYPFKQHKDNHWSLEHIHARKSENFDKTKKEAWLKWLSIHKQLLEEFDKPEAKVLIEKINKYNNDRITWERFSGLFIQINDFFTEEAQSMDQESEGLMNLALLSQPDNAALNNSVFEIKRREIIRLDKDGYFIPICTKRVFMKYYNENSISGQNFFWSSEDRKNYFEILKEVLADYLPEVTEINETEDYE
ncbi:hypothetical protein ABID42_004693 [Arcicella rosea]|uniref:DUF262 domain-containing protein n=1 Tax=Arcicella rosea TaxID=502909 RepID=UPI00345C9802